VLQFVAALLSFRFVWAGRLGRPWLLVSAALLLMGGLSAWEFAAALGESGGPGGSALPVYNFSVAVLLASGFLLTELWFRLRERFEARLRLIAEVDRELVGLLDEDRILATVCEVLARGKGCRAALVGAAQEDGAIRIVNAAGAARDAAARAMPRWDESPEGNNPAGMALRARAPFVARRFQGDARFGAFHAAAAEGGFSTVAAFPLDPFCSPRMVLVVCAAGRRALDVLECAALEAMASRVATALQSARRHEFFVSAKGAYDDLLRSQRDGVILVRGGRIVRANPAALGMLGCTAQEILGKDPAAVLLGAPPKPSGLAGLLRAGEPGGWHAVHEVPLRRGDGSFFEAEVTATWVPRSAARPDLGPLLSGPLGMIIFRDITARKRVMDELRRERDFSAGILDAAGLLVVQIDPAGGIVMANRHFESLAGLAEGGAAGRSMEEFLAEGEGRAAWARAFRRALGGEAPGEVECVVAPREGGERIVLWTQSPLRDDGGAVGSVLATGTDVTERRTLERQLVQMQKMEAIGTLAGGVAHDFNNILTGIVGNLDLAVKALPAGSAAAGLLHESIRASERAARLVRQLLEFSRRAPLERRAVRLGPVVSEVVHLLSQTIDRRIAVESFVAPDLWPAAADSNQIHQVLMNLCVNARDALVERLRDEMPGAGEKAGCWIRIRAGNVTVGEEYRREVPYARAGDFVRLSVSDNGRGMDPQTQRRVFEPFFTTKALGRGTGLGLSTVYGIVKQHEGWVTVESAPGRGTTFHVFLPRARDLPDEAAAPGAPVTRRGRETILFVDDEEMIRELGRKVLEAQGYTVLLAEDGARALETYAAHRGRIDLVILDQTMPSLSGGETLRRIRALDPDARVILSSGYARGQEGFPARPDGAAAFLQKPYRPDALLRAVRQVLDGPPA